MKIVSSVILFLILLLVIPVLRDTMALELSISSNGSGSDSEITLSSSENTQVSQNNNIQVDNNVTVDSQTGGNNTSSNAGEVSISTGDISTQTDITISGNVSAVNLNCCTFGRQGSFVISENGSGSDSQINADFTNTSLVNISQNADILNRVEIRASTGDNTANNNSSNTTIDTGDISIGTKIINHHLNIYSVVAPRGSLLDLKVRISGNGSDSINKIDLDIRDQFEVFIRNLAEINNVLATSATTGGNSASGNLGAVLIITGNIDIDAEIENGPINVGKLTSSCCNNQPNTGGPQDPADPISPTAPSTSNGSSSSSSSSSSSDSSSGSGGPGQILAAAAGQILPATGSYWIILMTLASMLMFLLGLYLRLHPGQDPGFKLAYT